MELEDERIVRLCKKNSREGYRMLYEKYHRYVYSLCYRSTYRHEDAMDLVQDVFLKVFKGMEKFDEKRPVMPWIKKITVNVLINHSSRKPSDEVPIDVTDDSSEKLFGTAREDESPEGQASMKETRALIEEAITSLPGNERTAIILRHFEGKSYEEIAKLLNCPLGTVKTYLYRARKLMRDLMKKKGAWEV